MLTAEGYATPGAAAKRFTRFVKEISIGDVILMPDTPRGEVVLGVVEGGYAFDREIDPEQYRHRRRVRWIGRHRLDDLPCRAGGRSTVSDRR